MATRRRPLSVHFHDHDDMSEPVLRELWELRLELLTLTRTREEDWATFRSYVVGPDRCLFAFRDTDGKAQGFFTIAFMPLDIGRRRLLLMYSKYFYFRRDYRGHPKTMMAPWRLLPMGLRRYGMRSLHFVTTAFPQSYVSLYRSSGRVWSLRDADTPDWKREALRAFASAFCSADFDEDTGLVGGANVADSDSVARSDEARRLTAVYESLNPDWRQGYTLPILFSVDARLVGYNLSRILRRMARRPQQVD